MCVGWTCRVWAAVRSPGVEYWTGMLIWGRWCSYGAGQITAFEKHERITNRYDGQGSAGCGAGGGITSWSSSEGMGLLCFTIKAPHLTIKKWLIRCHHQCDEEKSWFTGFQLLLLTILSCFFYPKRKFQNFQDVSGHYEPIVVLSVVMILVVVTLTVVVVTVKGIVVTVVL